MEEITEIIWTQDFEEDFKKIRDRVIQDRIEKQIRKIKSNPNFGKPLRYGLKGEWTIYVKPYRLIYKIEGDKLILLRFEHRDDVY
ncbi:MAG: type II toxin-antitoxin system RelE/ParE family toxin [Candidatus Aenigmarchaeota archaeon]|nr:type II toxin-antitoxin system RelE/ParE family toxin [Candidatus Aenigmarchaeota archaeon]